MTSSGPASPADPVGLAEIADAVVGLGEKLRDAASDTLVEAVLDYAVEALPGVRWASITTLRQGRFHTLAATGEEARAADAMPYELGSGPCVEAVLEDSVHLSEDVPRGGRCTGCGLPRRWGCAVCRPTG